jgi:hypothetical protein
LVLSSNAKPSAASQPGGPWVAQAAGMAPPLMIPVAAAPAAPSRRLPAASDHGPGVLEGGHRVVRRRGQTRMLGANALMSGAGSVASAPRLRLTGKVRLGVQSLFTVNGGHESLPFRPSPTRSLPGPSIMAMIVGQMH